MCCYFCVAHIYSIFCKFLVNKLIENEIFLLDRIFKFNDRLGNHRVAIPLLFAPALKINRYLNNFLMEIISSDKYILFNRKLEFNQKTQIKNLSKHFHSNFFIAFIIRPKSLTFIPKCQCQWLSASTYGCIDHFPGHFFYVSH